MRKMRKSGDRDREVGTRWGEKMRKRTPRGRQEDAICVELTSVYSKRGDEKREGRKGKGREGKGRKNQTV